MSERSAVATIKGYFYQFDYSIIQLLQLEDDDGTIIVEGIEDIDVKTATESSAIQCKYYEKTEYNHSVIAKPIRHMLTHFKRLKDKAKPLIKYLIYGKYKSGQDKLASPFDRSFLINHFLTYKKNKTKRYHHLELHLTDAELDEFIDLLEININAQEYSRQHENILEKIQGTFDCTPFEAEHYYYNNALSMIKNLSIQNDIDSRSVCKSDFIRKIDNKEILFNTWFIKLKGKKAFYKNIKQHYFNSGLNTSPYERFFLIEVPANNYVRSDLKELILNIQKKWSKLSQREKQSYCPYIYLHNINQSELKIIKTNLRDEGIYCNDGFDFYDAEFCVKSILKKATYFNDIKLKFVNKLQEIEDILDKATKTKEVYQFYLNSPFFQNNDPNIKDITIQIESLNDVKEITK